MIVRDVARFSSTLPEDIIETEDGEGFVRPPGKSVADAITVIFRSLGFEVYFGPEPESDFVWGIGVSRTGRNFRVGLNLVDDYFLTFTNPSWTDKLFGRQPAAYLDLLRGFARELDGDPRFSNLRWFGRYERAHEASGAPAPVE